MSLQQRHTPIGRMHVTRISPILFILDILDILLQKVEPRRKENGVTVAAGISRTSTA